MLRSKLLKLAVVGMAAVMAPTFAFADLAAFCTGAPPTTPGAILDIYNAQCPAYLQSQFAAVGGTNQSAGVTTSLAQQSSQESIATGYAGLLKAPPSQSAITDTTNLSLVTQVQDAKLTVRAAQVIGQNLQTRVDANNRVLLISPTDLQAYANGAADIKTVKESLTTFNDEIKKAKCSVAGPGPTAAPAARAASGPDRGPHASPTFAPVVAVYAVGALFSAGATLASSFQPSLVSIGGSKSVADPSLLMVAGLVDGLGKDKKQYLGVRPPTPDKGNAVIVALDDLRKTIVQADARLASCSTTTDAQMKEGLSEIADANAYVASLTVTSATSPISLFALAARHEQLVHDHYKYFLVLVRDVSAGGTATIKPNWYTSLQVTAGAVDGITYQLSDFDGVITESNFVAAHWEGSFGLESWATAMGDKDSILVAPQSQATAKTTTTTSATPPTPVADPAPKPQQ